MKNNLLLCLLGATLTLASACKKDADEVQAASICAPNAPVAKIITDYIDGYVIYDQSIQQYAVVLETSSIVGIADIGVLCSPPPAELRATGTKVRLSGTLLQYSPQPSSAPTGTTYYYLNATRIALK